MKQSGDIIQNRTGETVVHRQPIGDSLVEIKHPLSAIVANADAARRWLSREEPNFHEAIAALERIVKESTRIDQTIADVTAVAGDGSPTGAFLSSIGEARA